MAVHAEFVTVYVCLCVCVSAIESAVLLCDISRRWKVAGTNLPFGSNGRYK